MCFANFTASVAILRRKGVWDGLVKTNCQGTTQTKARLSCRSGWPGTYSQFCKNLMITLVFEKNANFFAENWQKSQKIVIITSTPDWANFRPLGDCLLWTVFFENYRSSPNTWPTLTMEKVMYWFSGLDNILDDFLTNSSGHPAVDHRQQGNPGVDLIILKHLFWPKMLLFHAKNLSWHWFSRKPPFFSKNC
jgi:hypothetical protein